MYHPYQTIFTHCRRILGNQTWKRILEALGDETDPQYFPEKLDFLKSHLGFLEYIPDLARVEYAIFQVTSDPADLHQKVDFISANPTLKLVPVDWKHLPALTTSAPGSEQVVEPSTETHVMVWRNPETGALLVREADNAHLLSLKVIVEKTYPEMTAAIGNGTIGIIDRAVRRSISQGVLISPLSHIRRNPPQEYAPGPDMQAYLSADTFTLQWHITQACDLHCRHCYDRSQRRPLPFDMAMAVLDDLYSFCQEMHVAGQVSFTGGNPLLYPHFMDTYKAAADRGFETAILGNPTPEEEIDKLIGIAKPNYFQISLEGLEAHNDHIRGQGHFQRSLAFLDLLKSRGIYTMVMLTLSNANIGQVLPLAELLRDRTDYFTFNRLSTVGEGARLEMAAIDAFQQFLRQYHAAAKNNPVLGFKDNLINTILYENDAKPFGGCTGYGCGAAFNFLALLADGEVHACRKFPSLIGNIRQTGLSEIYHSEIARQYRAGSQKCSDCRLSMVCGGCLAVTHSHGLDVFKDKDPYCFIQPDGHVPGKNV